MSLSLTTALPGQDQKGIDLSPLDHLMAESLINENQRDEANLRSRLMGRSPLDHLLAIGAATESNLLRVIKKSHGWTTVELTDVQIEESVLRTLPGNMAWKYHALPFARDIETNCLRIACPNPDNVQMREEILALLEGEHVEFSAALQSLLVTNILRLYRGENISNNYGDQNDADSYDNLTKCAYIISSSLESDQHIGNALLSEGYGVTLTDNLSEVIDEIQASRPELVLIRDESKESDSILIMDIKQHLPDCEVRTFRSASDLFLTPKDTTDHVTCSFANLQLATAVVADSMGESSVDSGQSGHFINRLCERMELSSYNHLITVTAGFVNDISRIFFKHNPTINRELAFLKLLALTAESITYPLAVLNILRQMYQKLSSGASVSNPDQILLNANIVTVVDYFFKQYSMSGTLTQMQYERIEDHMRSHIDTIFIPDVLASFLELLRDYVVNSQSSGSSHKVLMLSEFDCDNTDPETILQASQLCLRRCYSLEQFLHEYYQEIPDCIILALSGSAAEVRNSIATFTARGIRINDLPVIILHTSDDPELCGSLLRMGVYDAIRFDGSYEILRIKIQRLLEDRERESAQRLKVLHDLGTHGSLSHINVIDLLQSMGPSNKTLCINVSATGKQLTMYLDQGQLVYAANNQHSGVEAVYQALNWETGVWSVDQVKQSSLPEHNIKSTIDSILIKGCYLIDELQRKQKPQKPDPN